jgi:uncharacterized membrane protein
MIGRTLRRRLFAGLAVIAPVAITVFVLDKIFWWLDGLLGKFIYPQLPVQVPGLGLLLLVVILLIIGWAAERAVGRRAVTAWHSMLERFPLTRRLYGASNQIVRTVFGEDQRFFKEVVLVEYPAPGRWSLGFVTANAPTVAKPHIDDGVTIFIPTTPNPTTGYLVIVARSLVQPIPFTIEQAFTFILSAGGVQPDDRAGPPIPPAPGVAAPITVSPPELTELMKKAEAEESPERAELGAEAEVRAGVKDGGG